MMMMEKIFSAFELGAMLPKPTEVSDENVKYSDEM